MKNTAIAVMLALPMSLAACQNEPEEAPSIEEAIPSEAESGSGPTQAGDEPQLTQEQEGQPETPALPSTPVPPSTMESGSNPPDMTSPTPGSKVQRAD